MPIRRAFLWSMIVSLSLAAFIGVAALTFGSGSMLMGRIFGTTSAWACLSVVCLMQAIAVERRRLVPLMWVGMASAALAFLVWVFLIWAESVLRGSSEELLAKLGGTLSLLAVPLAPVGLIALPDLHARWTQSVRRLVYVCVFIFAALFTFMIWASDYIDWPVEDVLWRAVGVFAILSAAGVILVPVFWKLQGLKEQTRTTLPQRLLVRLICPRCESEQAISAGTGKCRNCGLRLNIDVEEPRCTCGYLLFQLQGERCPECGREIPEKDRWAMQAKAAAPEANDASEETSGA